MTAQWISGWLQNPLMETFGWTLLHSLWQLSLVAGCAAILLVLLRRASANRRYLFCCGTLVVMAVLPGATFFYLLPSSSPSLPTPIPFPATIHMPLLGIHRIPPSTMEIHRLEIHAPAAPRATLMWFIQPLLPYTVLTYFAGALLLSCRFFIGYARLRQLRRRAIHARSSVQAITVTLRRCLAIARPVQLLESVLVEVPTVIGALRPIILLPATAITGLSIDQLTGLLAHELAHIRRHDYLVNLIQTLVETLLFYHPAVWWVSAKMRQEREHACDDLALSTGITRLKYAQALTEMESLRGPAALTLAANSTALLPRIRRILGMQPARSKPKRLLTFSSTVIAAVVLGTLIYVIGCNTSGHHDQGESAGKGSQTTEQHETLVPFSDLTVYPTGFEDPGTAAHYRKMANYYENCAKEQVSKMHKAPEDPEVVELRAKQAEALRKADEVGKKEAMIRDCLARPIAELRADHQGMEKVIELLKEQCGCQISVDWNALRGAGFDRTTPVSTRLNELPLREVLVTFLSDVDQASRKLSYSIEDGAINITTREVLESAKYRVVRVFDIRNLLGAAETHTVMPPFGATPEDERRAREAVRTREMILKEIISTIQTTVAPETWRDAGGKVGAIRELNGQLIVNQTVANQRAVYRLLNQLQETRALQIAIEVRLMLVDQATSNKLKLLMGKDGEGIAQTLDDHQLAALFKTVLESRASTMLRTGASTIVAIIAVGRHSSIWAASRRTRSPCGF